MQREYCDLDGCWNLAPFEQNEPVFYDFDPDGIIEYVFCCKEHQLEWNRFFKPILIEYEV